MQSNDPVVIAMVGTGTGDGKPIPSGTLAITPDHLPNILTKAVSNAQAIGIRALNIFLTTFLSLSSIGQAAHAATDVMPSISFKDAILLSAMATLGGALKDLYTITSGLEKKWPLYTGNV